MIDPPSRGSASKRMALRAQFADNMMRYNTNMAVGDTNAPAAQAKQPMNPLLAKTNYGKIYKQSARFPTEFKPLRLNNSSAAAANHHRSRQNNSMVAGGAAGLPQNLTIGGINPHQFLMASLTDQLNQTA